MESIRISIIQTDIVWENKQENLRLLHEKLQSLRGITEIVVLPEMFSTGFSMQSKILAEPNSGETITTLKQWAAKFQLAICGSYIATENELFYNRAFFLTPEGEEFYYDKRHLFRMGREAEHFSAGDKRLIIPYHGWNICLLVCYDLRFPEPFQILAETCDLIIVAANWPEGRREHWKCLLQARAIECQVYLAGVNCCGCQKGLPYAGDSCIFAPDGKRIAGFLEGEGLLTARIREDTKEYRKEFPVRADRRWELYRRWYE